MDEWSEWRGLRVLPLRPWMTNQRAKEALAYYEQIDPIFNREGRYSIRGGTSWFEVGGKAYKENYNPMFNYDLNELNKKQLMSEERLILQQVIKKCTNKEIVMLSQKAISDDLDVKGRHGRGIIAVLRLKRCIKELYG